MVWRDYWLIERPLDQVDRAWLAGFVERRLAERELTGGLEVTSAGRYIGIELDAGPLRGTITVALAAANEPAFIWFSSDEVRGEWEPLYRFFVELARALGARQEAATPIEETADLDDPEWNDWVRRQRVAPPCDPARAGAIFIERYERGACVGAAAVHSIEEVRAAVAEHDVDVIRYFSTGEPFWKASYQRGDTISSQAVEDLYDDRAWQWDVYGGAP